MPETSLDGVLRRINEDIVLKRRELAEINNEILVRRAELDSIIAGMKALGPRLNVKKTEDEKLIAMGRLHEGT
jgi:hypothetical protein